MKRRQSIIEMEEMKKKEIIDKYTNEKKKLKAKKKQGIGHIQSSMQNLISRLEEGRNLAAPISSSSDSGDSAIIDIKIPNIVEERIVSEDLDEEEKEEKSDNIWQ